MFALNIILNQPVILDNAEPHKNGYVSYLQMEFKSSGDILVPDKKINVPCQELVEYLLTKDQKQKR